MDLISQMPFSPKSITAENWRAEDEDELFDEFIDSDSFNSSDNGTADRANADDWSVLFDYPPPYNQNYFSDSSKYNARNERFPIADSGKALAGSSDADRIVSLVDLDSIKYPTPPHSTTSHTRRKSGRGGDRPVLNTSKSKSGTVSKSSKTLSAPNKMSHSGGSRRPSHDKAGSTSGSSTASGRGQGRTKYPPPATAPTQSQWQGPRAYGPYEGPSSSGPHVPSVSTFRDPYASRSPAQLSRATSAQLSPLTSPSYEEFSPEEGSSYFHSPGTPYVTEADASLSRDYPSFSQYPESSSSFHFSSAHESSLEMAYSREPEYADSQVQPWWIPASATQPYTTTYPTANYHRTPHRDADNPESNYSNIGYHQSQNYLEPHHHPAGANISGGDKGRGRHHAMPRPPPQFAEPVLRSQSPSSVAPGVRKTSASGSGSAPTRMGSSSGSSKQSKRKPGGQSGSRRDSAPGIDFVNYTADDSKKILTGVAPSGSSKTKLRREKEAADRRKRMSRATAKAVQEAGGDLEALKREGFILEEEEEDEEEGNLSSS